MVGIQNIWIETKRLRPWLGSRTFGLRPRDSDHGWDQITVFEDKYIKLSCHI